MTQGSERDALPTVEFHLPEKQGLCGPRGPLGWALGRLQVNRTGVRPAVACDGLFPVAAAESNPHCDLDSSSHWEF